METITETTTGIVKINPPVLNHVVKNCEKEFLHRFGAVVLEILKENKEEFTFPSETSTEIAEYMAEFVVENLAIGEKLLENYREELKDMITAVTNKGNITVVTDENKRQIQLVGRKTYILDVHGQFQSTIAEMEKGLNIVTEKIPSVPKTKFDLLLLHGAIEMLEKDFHVEVEFEPQKNTITLKGTGKHVSVAKIEMLQKFSQITEDNVDLHKNEKRFLENGGLAMLNSGMKEIELKGMVSLSHARSNKAKVYAFDSAKIEDVDSYIKNNMFRKKYTLDEDSCTLLNSNKWEEFYASVTTDTSVMIFIDEKATEILLIGKKSEVGKAFGWLEEFMKRNTIVKENVELEEGYLGYLIEYCEKHIGAIEKDLEEHSVRVNFAEDAETVMINGTKEGVKQAKRQLLGIVSTIVKDTICFDKARSQKYIKSNEGKILIEGVESKNKCLIRLTEDNGGISTIIPSLRSKHQPDKPTTKLLCSYETPEKISLKVYKDNITAHPCDVIVNAANGDLKHVGGVAKSILDVGGREIQEECDKYVKENGMLFDGECFSGSPGKLPCKVLVHAVGPRWDSNKQEKICRLLSVTFIRALQKAMKYKSVAVPAIGSGVFGIPKDVCVDVMIEAAEKFSKENDESSLKEIHFVNNDDASGQVFVKKFREKFGGRSSFISNEAKTNKGRFRPTKPRFQVKSGESAKKPEPSDVSRKRKPDDFIFTKQNIKISIAVGDLSKYKVMHLCHQNKTI